MRSKGRIGVIVLLSGILFFGCTKREPQNQDSTLNINIERMTPQEIAEAIPKMTHAQRAEAARILAERARKKAQEAETRLKEMQRKAVQEGYYEEAHDEEELPYDLLDAPQ
ncbi:MAG: hypothetical protein JSW40_08050 [Candidatus Omnitrophota bacterium]|nr:MAG: hypothetical protein JSW40_08050 [Candidatus Omnitrophota bacterium]